MSEVLRVPDGGVLYWQYAAQDWRADRRVNVTISVRQGDQEEILYQNRVRTSRQEPRSWQQGRLDLSRWAGRSVELVFEARYAGGRSRAREAEGAGTGRIYWSAPHVAAEPGLPNRAPSVIMIVIDSLRADRLGVYGGDRDLTPHLDALAARGAVFDNAFSQTNWTLPSIASIISGLYPLRHGVTETHVRLKADRGNLARVFARNGYLTVGFHDGGYAQGRFGFADGFDEYRRIHHLSELDGISAWMARHRERPFFLFLHTYDVHAPYSTVPEEYWQLYVDPEFEDVRGLATSKPGRLEQEPTPDEMRFLADLYDGEVRYVDERLGELFGALDRLGLSRETILIVLSDHGEEFGEHGSVEHRTRSLHSELIHVPMILAGPGVPAGVRYQRPVQLVDLLPTLAELLNLQGLDAETLDGRSFASLLEGAAGAEEAPQEPIDLEQVAWSEKGDVWSVRSARWTLIGDRRGAERLYDRHADPGERHDVAAVYPEVVRQLRELLRRLPARETAAGRAAETEVDEALREELRALGYLN